MKKILLLALILLMTASVEAAHRETCKVKYMTRSGWSQYYTVDVLFMTGRELNEATRSYNYRSYSTYATIFWGNDQATVIELSTYDSCRALEVTRDCLTRGYGNLSGLDQRDAKWEICMHRSCY